MRKWISLISVLLFSAFSVFAQQRTITGKVVDDKNNPVGNASVMAKGTAKGTTTDEAGSFTLSISADATTLVVSSVNYATQEVDITSNPNPTIKLLPGNSALSEVVVVAYGSQKKTNVTGSVATVSSNYLENKPFTSVDKALQGAVPGLLSASTSGAPGSGTDIRIRGVGSINANANPLWVIDGVIATTGDLTSNTTTANALSSINPDDIESISVLKDAAATSVYGSRAANGVIIVTTKKGKAGKTVLTASGEAGVVDLAYKPKNNRSMTTAENKKVLEQALVNSGDAADTAEAGDLIEDPSNFGFNGKVNTNWLDVVTRTGTQQQYNVSLSGGTEKTQFYASGGYFSQDGTTIATYFKRYNGSLSVTHKASDKITFTAGINGSASEQQTPSNGGTFANPVLSSFFLLPWYSPYNADGTPRYGDTTEFTNNSGVFNPVAQAELNQATAKQTTIRGYVSGVYNILDNLKFTSRYSGELLGVQEDSYRNPFYGDGAAYGGDAFSAYHRVFDWTWTNLLDYRVGLNQAKDINLNLQLGQESQKLNSYLLQAGGQGFPGTLALKYLASASTPTTAYVLPSGTSTASYFSSANINYKDRYVISGSYRRDGSSVFGANHKWGNFYSVGASWNINEEEFLKNSNIISLLKLRTSYGENGNALGFGYYASLATYSYDANYNSNPGSRPNNVGNPDLTWEKNKAFDIGLDFGFFKNRLGGTIDYYDRNTSGLLANIPLSRTSGFTSQLQNIGAMSNKGFELSLNGRPVNSKNFTWDIAFNISHNTNRITELYGGRSVASGFYNFTVGHDLQSFYLRQWAGVDPANGDPLWYTDSTHSKTTNNYTQATRQLNYSAAPKYFGAFTNTFTYKGFSLQLQFNYNFGNYVLDGWGSYTSSEGTYLGSFNQLSNQLNAWQKAGDVTNIPKVIYGGNKHSYVTSTRFLYKGDYIRLRNVQFGYSFPKALLTKLHLSNLNVYVRGTNLLTFVKDKNLPFDPEAGIDSEGNLNVFMPKTVTAGLRVSL
jgi:TonB-linked SusC/RagA family outer membrane protein